MPLLFAANALHIMRSMFFEDLKQAHKANESKKSKQIKSTPSRLQVSFHVYVLYT